MWNPSKMTLFFLMLLSATFGGLTLNYVDWSVFETNKGIIKELQLPVTFLALSFYFMVPYVKKIKEEKSQQKK